MLPEDVGFAVTVEVACTHDPPLPVGVTDNTRRDRGEGGQAVPSISHALSVPVVGAVERMSGLPSPLKLPVSTIFQLVSLDNTRRDRGEGGQACSCS